MQRRTNHNAQPQGLVHQANLFMVTPVGPLAMIFCELRQARKGATVVVISCAEVWLAGEATSYYSLQSVL